MINYEINIQLQPSTFNIDLVTPFITVGGGGVTIHNETTDRDAPDAHPQGSVTGLVDALDEKLEDAPIDGVQYARKDGAWSGVEAGGGGSADAPQTLPFAVSMTPVLADGNIMTVIMTDDGTMNVPSDMTAGQLFVFRKIQDVGGGHVLTFAAGYKMSGDVALTLTGTADSIDKIGFRAISATEAEFEFLNYDV